MEDEVADRFLDAHQDLAPRAVEIVSPAKDLTGCIGELGAGDPSASANRGESLRPGEAKELGVDVIPVVEIEVDRDLMISEFCRAHEA